MKELSTFIFIGKNIPENAYLSHIILHSSFDKTIYRQCISNSTLPEIEIKCLNCKSETVNKETDFYCSNCNQKMCKICKANMYKIVNFDKEMCTDCYKEHCEICKSTDNVEYGLCKICLCNSIREYKKKTLREDL